MTLYLKSGNSYVAWDGEPIAGIRHPLSIENAWPTEDLAAIGLFVPRPAAQVPDGKIAIELGVEDVGGRPAYVWLTRDPTLAELRATKLAAIVASADALLTFGAPVDGGLHVALDDAARTDLSALVATATATSTGTVAWPESYSRGWITIENIRLPLATPAAGLTLAATVGDWYAAVIQHRRDLKDAALAAEDAAALDAIDETAGWPV